MHGTKVKCDFNKAINMHSRGPTEQHSYVWDPDCGYLLKVKKCPCAPSLKRENGAIILENVLVPPCSILLHAWSQANLSILVESFSLYLSRQKFSTIVCN